ncbi:zinc finger protein Xfin-like [Bacillus rossius redtenbacheri]|uniref:zinc finger protein Xfin-like n=1 Tax=Bacillus rossius redtenbacheri TaxID=93214 RepID=UPI002FDCED3D
MAISVNGIDSFRCVPNIMENKAFETNASFPSHHIDVHHGPIEKEASLPLNEVNRFENYFPLNNHNHDKDSVTFQVLQNMVPEGNDESNLTDTQCNSNENFNADGCVKLAFPMTSAFSYYFSQLSEESEGASPMHHELFEKEPVFPMREANHYEYFNLNHHQHEDSATLQVLQNMVGAENGEPTFVSPDPNGCHPSNVVDMSVAGHEIEAVQRNYFKCEICNILYSDEISLKEHCKQSHRAKRSKKKPKENGGENKLGSHCPLCSKYFTYRFNLKRHMKLHTGAPFVCEKCSKSFMILTDFKKHQKVPCMQENQSASLACST